MASLISAATGNFTAAGSWGVVGSPGEIDSEAGTVAISTSNIDSPVFTPGATAIDGIALKMSARAASPSGTFTVTLRNSTTATDVLSVTVNVSDLPSVAGSKPEWVFFKFGSTTTPNGTDSYVVRVVCSTTGSQVTLYRSTSGTNNISKKVRLTTTGAPAAGDHLIVCAQLLSAGSRTDVTITLDNTATTSFGPTVSGGPPQGMVISGYGVLSCGTTASTAYALKIKGVLLISGSGTFNCGSNGSELPASSSLTVTFDCVANVDSGLECVGTLGIFGAPKTAWTTLTADAAAAATTISVADKTGWADSDELCFAPTGNNTTEGEKKTINSAATPTLTAGLTYAHSGTSPRAAEVGNLTRNVLFTGASSSLRGYLYFGPSAGGTMRHYKITHCGTGTTNKRCMDVQTTAVSAGLNLEDWVVVDLGNNVSECVRISGSASDKFYIRRGIQYNCNREIINLAAATTGTDWEVSSCLSVGVNGAHDALGRFVFVDCGGIIKNNVCSGATQDVVAIAFSDAGSFTLDETNHGGNVSHNNASIGITIGTTGSTYSGTLANLRCYFNGRQGVTFAGSALNVVLKTPALFGNLGGNGGNLSFVGPFAVMTVLDGYIANTSVRTAPLGATFGGAATFSYARVTFRNTTFGVSSGILSGHSTADFGYDTGGNNTLAVVLIALDNVTLASSTFLQSGFLTTTPLNDESKLTSQKHNATEDDHRHYVRYGVGQIDAAVYQTAAPSQKLTPNSASGKLQSSVFRKPGNDGGTVTIEVAVRKNASYNGNQPRLILKANAAIGIGTADIVCDTMTVGLSTWETLTYTTGTLTDDGILEFYVDCDGTAGAINVDDWA